MKHCFPGEKELYSNLTVENITDAECKHMKRVPEDFEKQNVGEYQKVPSDIVLRVDIFKSFRG